jgi:F0F1-type ATP synthase membrane subunit b/b'
MMTRVRPASDARRRAHAWGLLVLAVALSAALWGAGVPAAVRDAHGVLTLPRGAVGFLAPRLEASMRHQPAPAEQGAPAGEGHEAEEGEGSGLLGLVGKIVNSAILVGTLVYFLRAPVAQYLQDRMEQVRQDLVSAAGTRAAAAAELERIERRLVELPGEIEALRSRGARELAVEDARIRAATEVQRERLLSQTRREIELQARAVERDLLERTADTAVRLATERIRRSATDKDQLRLIDRYVEQVTAGS